jgi:hypothetical protein
MSCRLRRLAKRIHAITFINHVVMAAQCARSPGALERWGEAFEAQVFQGRRPEESTHKWRRYLKGVLVGPALRVALMRQRPFTGLLLVLTNPLWSILAWLEKPTRLPDRFADDLRLNDRPLSRVTLKSCLRLIKGSTWIVLCIQLAILASHSNRYYEARVLFGRHFTLSLLLMCSEPELTGTARLLYEIISTHLVSGRLAPVHGWPTSLHAFKLRLKQVHALKRWLRSRNPKATITPSALLFELLTDNTCRAALSQNADDRIQAIWPRCRRLASRNVRIARGTVFNFATLACHPAAFRGRVTRDEDAWG